MPISLYHIIWSIYYFKCYCLRATSFVCLGHIFSSSGYMPYIYITWEENFRPNTAVAEPVSTQMLISGNSTNTIQRENEIFKKPLPKSSALLPFSDLLPASTQVSINQSLKPIFFIYYLPNVLNWSSVFLPRLYGLTQPSLMQILNHQKQHL